MRPSSETYHPVRALVKVSEKSRIRKNFLGEDRESALRWRAFGSVAALAVLVAVGWMWIANTIPDEIAAQSAVAPVELDEK